MIFACILGLAGLILLAEQAIKRVSWEWFDRLSTVQSIVLVNTLLAVFAATLISLIDFNVHPVPLRYVAYMTVAIALGIFGVVYAIWKWIDSE